jgi:hypothetical protein
MHAYVKSCVYDQTVVERNNDSDARSVQDVHDRATTVGVIASYGWSYTNTNHCISSKLDVVMRACHCHIH